MQEVSGVRLPEIEKERVKRLIGMGYYLNAADFLRDAVRCCMSSAEVRHIGREIKRRFAPKLIRRV